MQNNMMKAKKGFIQFIPAVIIALFSSPIILLGIAIFALILIVPFYFMLGKVLGTILVIIGSLVLFRLKALYIGLIIIGIGVLIFVNPFDFLPLQMMWGA